MNNSTANRDSLQTSVQRATSADTFVLVRVRESLGLRRHNEPISVGVAYSQATVGDRATWRLASSIGDTVPTQVRVLGRWPDGSIRWILVSFLASVQPLETAEFRLFVSAAPLGRDAHVRFESGEQIAREVKAVGTRIELGSQNALLRFFPPLAASPSAAVETASLLAITPDGQRVRCRIEDTNLIDDGPVRRQHSLSGHFEGGLPLLVSANVSLYGADRLACCEVTITNPSRARHSSGYWDLGDPASVLLGGLYVELKVGLETLRKVQWQEGPGAPIQEHVGPSVCIHQHSSGGDKWMSRNHVDRHNEVRLIHRGFKVQAGDRTFEGLRASPVLSLGDEHRSVSLGVAEFWQKFPTAVEVDDSTLRAWLLPEEPGVLHEIQPGECLTRTVWFSVADEKEQEGASLAWIHAPLGVVSDVDSLARTRALPFLSASNDRFSHERHEILTGAVDGNDSFFQKREAIDEYGWRHYGDVWADHEQAYCTEPKPVISHYNNQYDLLYGLLVQYLVSGDFRWLNLADPLARHILDIDLYHTDCDKSAYSGGMFWHTAHYLAAETAGHRSMSRRMIGKPIAVSGGGPGNEHNYTSGLLLHYFLTGNTRSRDAVLQLADWVLAMDDGRQHLLGLVSDHPTGNASRTSEVHYHGPGRGAGNSINALIDGWLAGDDVRYLEKAEELIRRTIHPRDDIAERKLDNAELRWSYTVYLQVLCRFLEVVPRECVGRDLHAYVRASILHYARWMADHECCYLDHPEKLEYPTETWAAQDLRKGNVLLLASRLTSGPDHDRFAQRGREILDKAWKTLMSFPTRTCTRALALVLQQGYIESFLTENPGAVPQVDMDGEQIEFGQPAVFVSQKEHVRQLLRSPSAYPRLVFRLANVRRWWDVWRRSWWAERVRKIVGRAWSVV